MGVWYINTSAGVTSTPDGVVLYWNRAGVSFNTRGVKSNTTLFAVELYLLNFPRNLLFDFW